ncbi:DUF4114 domain-containing protein [Thermosynechococcaceae cyanobacterium BACA0444]|uniref:DUF4114 domain-containing protein n=1 Tax=Pseudocalidococcus azoricus BACA0444 TaxID=2918990 RepID=A0AAE4FU14_9CYAN|nr:DUF4114 domain-containing protein [Pseudocalidococcus azoricus]MDS3861369.1 DUF4114 domain-containing protein [Pseudocalidococcus azoricus BACA0444]
MTIQYTPRAHGLLTYLVSDRLNTSGQSSSLNTNILLNSDLFSVQAGIFTANYGFEGYMGIPGMDSTDATSQQIAFDNNVAWNNLGNLTTTLQRAYTSAISTDTVQRTYGVDLEKNDNIPIVLTWPLLPKTVNPTDFQVILNTGTIVTPAIASFLPNSEYNERQTVVITGEFGNRLTPGQPGAIYPISVKTILDSTPLEMVGPNGPISAVGLTIDSLNPYVEGNGPKIIAAKLNRFSDLGEGAPIWLATNQKNSGSDLYGNQSQFRLRTYTSAGFSPDGIASLLPTEFGRYFRLQAEGINGQTINLTQTGINYDIPGFGIVRVVGLADLAAVQDTYDLTYIEDHDNYYDIILAGDETAVQQIRRVEMPSAGDYSPVYNPGGPGNDPENGPPGPFTVPSSPHSINVQDNLTQNSNVSYVEVDGPVMRNPFSGTPIGNNLGLAVKDLATGHQIYQYVDPDGKNFYASFAAATDEATDLALPLSHPIPIDLIDARNFTQGTTVTVSGSYSREAAFESSMGFYRLLDSNGSVLDPLTGTILAPGQAGYSEAALSTANRLQTSGSTLTIGNLETKSFSFNIMGGGLYAPFLQVNALDANGVTKIVYFTFGAANQDGLSHGTKWGANVIGFEDLLGGGDFDFDDIILRFSLNQ